MATLSDAWGAIRACLGTLYFHDIKQVVGLAGLDTTRIAHIDEKLMSDGTSKRPTKGALLAGIEQVYAEMGEDKRRRFLATAAEEIVKQKPGVRVDLEEYLRRLGWQWVDNALIPVGLFDTADLAELPEEPRADLLKAAQRFRDGDLSGAISAACGAVDAATSLIYEAAGLGDPEDASFQERCNCALKARGIIAETEIHLGALGWDVADTKPFAQNLKGALNQGAYVMQTLRAKMGDVHGTKPILKPLVFDSLKWAEILVRTLTSPT